MRTRTIIGMLCIIIAPIIGGLVFSYEYHSGFFEDKREIIQGDVLQPDVYQFEPKFVYRDGHDYRNWIENTDQSQIQIDFYTKTNGTYTKISKPEYEYQLVKGDDGYDHADYSRPIYRGMSVSMPNDNNPMYMAVTVETKGIYLAPKLIANPELNHDISNFTLDSINNNLLKSWIFEINKTSIKNEAYSELKLAHGQMELIRVYYIMYYPSSYYDETKTVKSISP